MNEWFAHKCAAFDDCLHILIVVERTLILKLVNSAFPIKSKTWLLIFEILCKPYACHMWSRLWFIVTSHALKIQYSNCMYNTRCFCVIFHSYRADGEPWDTLLHSTQIYWIKRLLHLLGSITICVAAEGAAQHTGAHSMEIRRIFSVISLLANLLSNLFILAYVKVHTKYSDPNVSHFRSVGFIPILIFFFL